MKKILLFLSLMVFSVIAFSQSLKWQRTIGGANSDWLSSAAETPDGGFIAGGSSDSDSSGLKTEDNRDTSLLTIDFWIVKTDSIGNIQWERTLGGNLSDELSSVINTPDGGFLCGGSSNSNISGDKTENSKGGFDFWIIKLDSNGNTQWQKTIGGNSTDRLSSICTDNTGGFLLAGSSGSGISGDKTEANIGSYDYWVVKIDSAGNIQWQNNFGGPAFNELKSVAFTNDHGFICGGRSDSGVGGDKTEGSNGVDDYWVVKLDSVGNIQWQNTIGGNNFDYLNSVSQTSDGGYICGGYSGSYFSGDKSEGCYGDYDYWIVKLNASGAIVWENTIGGDDIDVLWKVEQTPDGGYVCIGESSSGASYDKSESSYGLTIDYWIIKLDDLGNIAWQNTIGGNGGDMGYVITRCQDGGYFCAGASTSGFSGDKTEPNFDPAGLKEDFWIFKLDEISSVTGKLYADANSNGAYDGGEVLLSYRKIMESNTGSFTFSGQSGNYSFYGLDTGSYTVAAENFNSNFSVVPASHQVTLNTPYQVDSLNDFAFQPLASVSDLNVHIIPLNAFRSGFSTSYMIYYSNAGTNTLNASLVFYPDNNLTYVSSNVVPSALWPDSISWSVSNLRPLQSGSILVMLNVTGGLPISTIISSAVKIDPVSNDITPADNSETSDVIITGSYDPNDILVDRSFLTVAQLATQPFLYYTIRFQNTGNDTAFTVKIMNPIDTNSLELSSIEVVTSSHNANVNWLAQQQSLEFVFSNILLPDSNTNEVLSHGFIQYRIKPKTGLLPGDSIVNNASIYFDFNAPVLTNNAITVIVIPTGFEGGSASNGEWKIYPNPAGNDLFVSGNILAEKNATVKIYNAFGSVISESEMGSKEFVLPLNRIVKGIYFIEIVSNEKCWRSKFVKR